MRLLHSELLEMVSGGNNAATEPTITAPLSPPDGKTFGAESKGGISGALDITGVTLSNYTARFKDYNSPFGLDAAVEGLMK